LVEDELLKELEKKENLISKTIELSKEIKFTPKNVNQLLESKNSSFLDNAESLRKLVKRPELRLKELLFLVDAGTYPIVDALLDHPDSLRQVEIELKYEGYIVRQQELITKMEKLESLKIPLSFDY